MGKPGKHGRSSASIPLDLMIEIFTRLPAKSLMKFKCLSKQYASIIESRNFADSFFSYNSSKQRPCMLLSSFSNKELTIYSTATNHTDEEPSTSTTTLVPRHVMTFPYLEKSRRTSPVRGLICYSVKPNQYVICNLTTGQLFHLPRSETWEEEDYDDEYLLLGYEPNSDRFKVISLLKKNAELQCWIFTVGDGLNSWRKIENMPSHPSSPAICVNGVLYYEAVEDDTTMMQVVSFDLKTEKFNLIKLPPAAEEVPELIDFQGKIAFIECFEEIRIWVLENAEKHEWSSKSYNLPLTSLNLNLEPDELDVVGICEGEIVIVLIQSEGDQVKTLHLDMEKKTTRQFEIKMPLNYYDGNWTCFSVNHFDSNIVML